MKRILHLTSSLMGNESYSIKLGRAIVDRLLEKYPGSEVEEVDLVATEVPHLTPATLRSFFVPGDQLTTEDQESIRYSNDAVKQLLEADILVIGAPLYNYTIHTALKAWIDHIVRAGITFGYGADGPIGMVKGKKVYVAMSSGGVFSEGPNKVHDFVAPYLRTVFGFLGMTDLTVIRAEGLKIPGIKEEAMDKAIAGIEVD